MMLIQRKLVDITNSLYHRIYLLGWRGWIMPRYLRKLIAHSEIHRSWFLGYNAYFEEDGVAYGLARPYAKVFETLNIEAIHELRHIKEHERTPAQQLFIEAQDPWFECNCEICLQEKKVCKIYSDAEITEAQWNDYYEYTGMADLAHESLAEEKTRN